MNFSVNQYNGVLSPLGKMDFESVKKVAEFYLTHPFATAAELGVSGAFMSSLVKRGYAKVVGKREGDFFPVGNGLYRKSEVNEYVLTVSVSEFWSDFVLSAKDVAYNAKYNATKHIEYAQSKLSEAKTLLDNVNGINF